LAHSRGARVFSDQAQYLSSHREDVQAVDVDFAAFSAHKLGGPFGLGVLYGKENLLNRLGRYKVGGGAIKSVNFDGARATAVYLDAPMRLEPGVPDFAAAVGLSEALKLLTSLPPDAVRAHVGGLARRAAEKLAKLSEIKVLGDPSRLAEGALVSFSPVHAEFSMTDLNLFLNHELGDRFIAVRAGEHCAHLLHRAYRLAGTVRASFFAYNTPAEVDLYVDAVETYAKAACA
jgi:cysteine desulfurase/selenocysteine lyase